MVLLHILFFSFKTAFSVQYRILLIELIPMKQYLNKKGQALRKKNETQKGIVQRKVLFRLSLFLVSYFLSGRRNKMAFSFFERYHYHDRSTNTCSVLHKNSFKIYQKNEISAWKPSNLRDTTFQY